MSSAGDAEGRSGSVTAPAAATEGGVAVELCAGGRSAVALRDAEIVAEIAEIERAVRVARMRQLQLIAEAGHRGLHVERGARSPQA